MQNNLTAMLLDYLTSRNCCSSIYQETIITLKLSLPHDIVYTKPLGAITLNLPYKLPSDQLGQL